MNRTFFHSSMWAWVVCIPATVTWLISEWMLDWDVLDTAWSNNWILTSWLTYEDIWDSCVSQRAIISWYIRTWISWISTLATWAVTTKFNSIDSHWAIFSISDIASFEKWISINLTTGWVIAIQYRNSTWAQWVNYYQQNTVNNWFADWNDHTLVVQPNSWNTWYDVWIDWILQSMVTGFWAPSWKWFSTISWLDYVHLWNLQRSSWFISQWDWKQWYTRVYNKRLIQTEVDNLENNMTS